MFKLVVLSIAFAVAAAKPSIISPLGLGLGWGGIAGPLHAPLIAPAAVAAAPLVAGHNYRGPLSLAPGQPANILAADGRPLDTLSVNLDRAAHLTARAVDGGIHLLKKRSVLGAPLVGAIGAPLVGASLVGAPVIGAHLVAPAPVSVSAAGHILPIGLGWGHGVVGHGVVGHGVVGHGVIGHL